MAEKKKLVIKKKKDVRHHMLDRPDTYVGSDQPEVHVEYILEEGKIVPKKVEYVPALLQIFHEIRTNAIDNVWRSSEQKIECKKIEFTHDEKTNRITIRNDGLTIPVELSKEEGCENMYQPELVFGVFWTSSNYDDTEERKTSGRNGYGAKTCLKSDTLVPTWDGKYKQIKNIGIGETLIGDDGNPRKVLNKTIGYGKLYKVTQDRNKPYIVNENHILSLCMPDHKVIFWNSSKQGWTMLWLDKENLTIHSKSISATSPKIECPECHKPLCGNLNRHYTRVHPELPLPALKRKPPTVVPPDTPEIKEARERLEKFAQTITDDNTIDIPIQEYMKLTKTMKGRLSGFTGDCVNWPEQKVELDPYIMGLWLGDGAQAGTSFAINAKDDFEILKYVTEWGKTNDGTVKQIAEYAYYVSSTSKCGVNPLKRYLSKYKSLLDIKHIPAEYLVNSREVRLKVLAGLIDSDGTVSRDGTRIVITQTTDGHSVLAFDIVSLARSLGFMVCHSIKDTVWEWMGERKKGKAHNINISGNGLEDIPTLLPRKKCSAPVKRETTNTGTIKIEQTDDGEYVGLEVDSNHRFVLDDYTVTHNCNAFSNLFEIETYDPEHQLLYKQRWSKNMSVRENPTITKVAKLAPYTQVSYIADFDRLNSPGGYSQDVVKLMERFMIDTAMITKVPVFINDEKTHIKSLDQYAQLFCDEETKEFLSFTTGDSEVVVMPNPKHHVIAFTNGAYNSSGGVHVDAWTKSIFTEISNKFNPKPRAKKTDVKKKPKDTKTKLKAQEEKKEEAKLKLTYNDVKKLFSIFINCSLDKPKFDTQSKTRLTAPKIEAPVDPKQVAKVAKWSVALQIKELLELKKLKALKKLDAKKKYVRVEGLENANFAGTSRSHECTLILCEGKSAKTFAVTGIGIEMGDQHGRDIYGILPLRGKILNVRKASQKQITSNKVVQDIIQAIKLKIDVDYTQPENFKELAYGRIMVITDADVDGSHIEGLLMNLFHRLFPSLLLRDEPFFVSMRTPLVRVYMKNGDVHKFYSVNTFKEFHEANINDIKNVRYFKGLGTSEDEDIIDCFGERIVEYEQDDVLLDNMNKVFGKSVRQNTDLRKKWIGEYDPENTLEICDDEAKNIKMNCSDFINNEFILFSIDDCARSIPWIDGLKVSQRKILYTCIKEKLRGANKQLKVAQLAGSVAKLTQYHHGEACLFDTIIGMAQDFVGANNIPLLEPIGQFGSRLQLGKDAAQARYIFTRLSNVVKYLFRDEDNESLEYMDEDGERVEPKFFVPIIPMSLVNGACGIGTGWSTDIPNFNPIDVINAVRIWIKCDGNINSELSGMVFKEIPELIPWYSGFTGPITKDTDTRFVTSGIVEEEKGKKVVKELPIGMATDKFRTTLDSLKESKSISSYKDYSTKYKVNFVVNEKKDGMKCNLDNLKLHTYLNTTNMVMFTAEGKIKRYETAEEIIDEFCWLRFKYYQLRKDRILGEYRQELVTLNNKYRFVNDVMDEKITVFRRKRTEVSKDLEDNKYDKVDGEYMYLLRMHIDSFTTETLEKLRKEIDKCQIKIRDWEALTIQQIWLNELDELEAEYKKYILAKSKKVGKTKAKKKKQK